jgi:omega-amidase
MNTLKVQMLQFSPAWGQVEENLIRLDKLCLEIQEPVDLVVLPEMFSTGFVVRPSEALVEQSAKTLPWMIQKSSSLGIAIAGSILSYKEGKLWNEFILATPQGVFPPYYKRHLFSYGAESEYFTAGRERVLWHYKGWRIFPCICYDLRFPVWLRNNLDYDMLLCVANWPVQRMEHWKALLKARAIENLTYCLGVNRVGEEPTGLEYSGNSCLFDYQGNPLGFMDQEEISSVFNLSKEKLTAYRNQFGFLSDQDHFQMLLQ